MKFTLCGNSSCFFTGERGPFFGAIRSFKSLAVTILVFNIFLCDKADAQFAGQFSLSVGEEYNDNIFFSKQKEHDFITQITPTFTILFQPAAATARTFKFDISPTGQLFARHPEQNNFGRNLSLGGSYIHEFSPELSLNFNDTLRLQGDTRTVGVGANVNTSLPGTPTGPPVPGLSPSQRLGNFISNGDTFSNSFSVQGNYLFTPSVTLSSHYTNAYSKFFDVGGSEVSNTIGVRGVYKWRQDHNLHAGYTIGLLSPRNGGNNVIHSFDIGDDYFSSTLIQLTPTLTLSGSSGISLNAGRDGPRIANNSTVTLIKIWERALFTAGAQKGLTNSFGVSGVSDTLTFFSTFNIRLSERILATTALDYSRFDTDDADFNTLQASVDLQYAITSWLCPSLRYSHRRRAGGDGASNSSFQTRRNVYGNSVFISVSAHFDVWPNLGRSRVQGCGGGLPTIAPQLPQRPSFGFPSF